VRVFLAGDMKFTLTITGHMAANCGYPCSHCYVHKTELGDFSPSPPRPACGTPEAKDCLKGRKLPNLVPWIPRERIIYDTLHCLLRIGGRFVDYLASELIYGSLWTTSERENKTKATGKRKRRPKKGARLTRAGLLRHQREDLVDGRPQILFRDVEGREKAHDTARRDVD
jgi:hypothetical protein